MTGNFVPKIIRPHPNGQKHLKIATFNNHQLKIIGGNVDSEREGMGVRKPTMY